ncbi:hypothetical protein A4A32_02810 [Staphylococcus equorum]|nr:hypothetical protein A4A29_05725 [Staphylococcus equorum]OIS55280.1 hypothetical protein A4A32_02810 [Staphylococcus equorum]OIS61501.1 hypothetical protein A4A34_03115 [Staphylococcus equorum]OIX98018.1 hypothetical protein BFN02_05445 [Staphylococcus equorum]
MNSDIIISLLCFVTSLLTSFYIIKTKNIKIIASIEPHKVPKSKINNIAYLFVVCLMLATTSIVLAILTIDYNEWVAYGLCAMYFIVLSVFYVYYMTITK